MDTETWHSFEHFSEATERVASLIRQPLSHLSWRGVYMRRVSRATSSLLKVQAAAALGLLLLVLASATAAMQETENPSRNGEGRTGGQSGSDDRAPETGVLVLERSGATCPDDPNCFNRLHPNIPMVARAHPGQRIVFETRNADDPGDGPPGSTIHPLSGPVHIEGAKSGDVLAVKIIAVRPVGIGITLLTPNGLLADQFPGPRRGIVWELGPDYATTDALPGVRIPNAGFPGVITVLPGPKEVKRWAAREYELANKGGKTRLPEPINAVPSDLCGPGGSFRQACLRTGPPREHGGNMDIRYHRPGTTIYLPCYIDGCGLAFGDVHYAQGDGEVGGTAIEMAADVTVEVDIRRDMGGLPRGPHYEGRGEALGRTPARFYATTGLPIKNVGEVPPHLDYLKSPVVPGLEVLSDDLMLAARNALLEMIDHLVGTRGYSRDQAYLLTSVAVDLRIGQVVDAGNVNVSAILPMDIFVDQPNNDGQINE